MVGLISFSPGKVLAKFKNFLYIWGHRGNYAPHLLGSVQRPENMGDGQ